MKTPTAVMINPEIWYRCPECDNLIDDQGRRCADCNKFGSRTVVYLRCPHCDEQITEEDLP